MKAKPNKRLKQSFSSDRPIRSNKDDILGRAKFAARLADDIHSWEGDDSFVIGLYGSWGSGKSSVKNMLLEANRKKRSPLPVLEFNPWQLSGTGGIPASFFRELGLALKRKGTGPDVEKRMRKLSAYAATLTVAGTTVDLVGKVLPWAGIPGGPLVQTVAAGMKSAAGSVKEGGDALKAQNEAADTSLEEQKSELSHLLASLPQPLLVVVDDIDRLATHEILQVFQLVKANADFPRLIYLLLFEREVVSKALDEISCNKGNEFLEKIVQVGYHIPHASLASVQRVLFAGIDKHLKGSPASKYWDKDAWRNLYTDGIAGYFRNLRHVYRFLTSFTFHFQHHLSETSFEVNPVDLLGLETLRVFETGVYERLPGAKTILTRYERSSFLGEIKQEVVDEAVSQIVSVASPETRTRVLSILQVLFPPLLTAYGGKHEVSRHHAEWLRSLRVCHPELFEKYFTLAVAADDLSQGELDTLLVATSDAKKFVFACESLKQRGLLKIAFERLDAYKEQIPLSNLPALIQALCDFGDSLPEKQPDLLEHGLNTYAWRICYFGLKREPDKKKRLRVLENALSCSSGLLLPFELVTHEERVGEREARGHEFLIDESDTESLKKICIEKFRQAAGRKGFREISQLRFILLTWSNWDSPDQVKALISGQLHKSTDASWLLSILLGESHSYGAVHTVRYSIALGLVERFVDLVRLKDLLSSLKSNELNKRERIAVKEFEEALKRRAEGKPDNVEREFDGSEEVLE